MDTSQSNITINTEGAVGEFIKGTLLIIAFVALIIPFAVKFYQYF